MWKLFLAGKAFKAALTADQAAPEVLVLVDPTIEVSALMTPALSALVWFNAENASQVRCICQHSLLASRSLSGGVCPSNGDAPAEGCAWQIALREGIAQLCESSGP